MGSFSSIFISQKTPEGFDVDICDVKLNMSEDLQILKISAYDATQAMNAVNALQMLLDNINLNNGKLDEGVRNFVNQNNELAEALGISFAMEANEPAQQTNGAAVANAKSEGFFKTAWRKIKDFVKMLINAIGSVFHWLGNVFSTTEKKVDWLVSDGLKLLQSNGGPAAPANKETTPTTPANNTANNGAVDAHMQGSVAFEALNIDASNISPFWMRAQLMISYETSAKWIPELRKGIESLTNDAEYTDILKKLDNPSAKDIEGIKRTAAGHIVTIMQFKQKIEAGGFKVDEFMENFTPERVKQIISGTANIAGVTVDGILDSEKFNLFGKDYEIAFIELGNVKYPDLSKPEVAKKWISPTSIQTLRESLEFNKKITELIPQMEEAAKKVEVLVNKVYEAEKKIELHPLMLTLNKFALFCLKMIQKLLVSSAAANRTFVRFVNDAERMLKESQGSAPAITA